MDLQQAIIAFMTLIALGSSVALIHFLYFYGVKQPAADLPSYDPVREALHARVTRDRTRYVRVAAGILAGSLMALIIHALVVDTGRIGQSGQIPGGMPDAFNGGPAHVEDSRLALRNKETSALSAYWAALGLGGFAMLVGALLLLAGKSGLARWTGALMLGLSLFMHGSLIREVKFGDLLKFETRIDRLADLTLKLEAQRNEQSRFEPRLVATISHFAPGNAHIPSEMKSQLTQICGEWKNRNPVQQGRMLQVIGSTDRVPLSASIRRQFESNVGLAQARAEQVKTGLVQCGVRSDQIMTMVAGPKNTASLPARGVPDGVGDDRSVTVWAFGSIASQPK